MCSDLPLPAWNGVLAVGVLAAIGGGLDALAGIPAHGAAAIVLALALIAGVFVPNVASRMAGLRIRPLPTNPEEFQVDIDPEPSREVLAKTATADNHIASLYLGFGTVALGCLVVLGRTPGWSGPTLGAVASCLLLLHGREMMSARQRAGVLVPGAIGLTVIAWSLPRSPSYRLDLVVGLLVVAGLLIALLRGLPGRRLLPHWGRIADILHMLLAIAVIPLVLAVLDVYSKVRHGIG